MSDRQQACSAWEERPAWWTLAGGAMILAGLVIRCARRGSEE
jgi:hypothetical protein